MRVLAAAALFVAAPAASFATETAAPLRADVRVAMTIAPSCSSVAAGTRGIASTCSGAAVPHVYLRPAGSTCTTACEVTASATAAIVARRPARPGAVRNVPEAVELYVEF